MSDSIGARLRQARELRRLTLPQVSETTKLRTHYLQALENDDYSAIPSSAQARGFLRIYAAFLELDMAELLPSAAPEPAAPAQAATPAPKPIAAAPAPTNLLGALRKRFSRPKKDEAMAETALSSLAVPVAEASPAPVAQEAAAPASSEAQTARRPKADSKEVKKNELG